MDLEDLYRGKPTGLVNAVREGDINAVENYLKLGKLHPNNCDHRGWIALHEAAALDRLEIVQLLLDDERTNANASTHEGETPLEIAIKRGVSLAVIECLAQHTEDLSKPNYKDYLLYLAAGTRSTDNVKYLIEKWDAKLDYSDPISKNSPVEKALKVGILDSVSTLLHRVDSCYVSKQREDLLNKLFVCAVGYNCSFPIVRLFLSRGVDINSKDSRGTPVLLTAIQNSNSDVALELLNLNADPNIVVNNQTSLIQAVMTKQVELLKKLLCMSSLDILESLDEQPNAQGLLCCAVFTGKKEIVSIVLNHKLSNSILESPINVVLRRNQCNLNYRHMGPLAFLLKEKLLAFGNDTLVLMNDIISAGVSIEPRKISYVPPLVAALLSRARNVDECVVLPILKPVLMRLLQLGVNVDHMSNGLLPDALGTVICVKQFYLFRFLLLYSRFTPCDLVQIGIAYNMEFVCTFVLENMIENDDYSVVARMLKMGHHFDDSARIMCQKLSSKFTFGIPSLQICARKKVRECLQKTDTSGSFLKSLEKLQIPQILKEYLRYNDWNLLREIPLSTG